MTDREDTGRRWGIGELAKDCGITVRALHHYDQIGLLPASERTGSGHRRYTENDLHRLYRIRALQMLGLSLEEIRGALDAPDSLATLRQLLVGQLGELSEREGQIRALQLQIRGLLRTVEASSMPGPEQFMTTLEMITVFENYFTAEQRNELADRRAALGNDSVEAAKKEWAALVEEGLKHVQAGTPVHDPPVQDLVRRWDALGSLFHSGEQTKAAARSMWQQNSGALSQALPWPADRLSALVAYLQQARDAVGTGAETG